MSSRKRRSARRPSPSGGALERLCELQAEVSLLLLPEGFVFARRQPGKLEESRFQEPRNLLADHVLPMGPVQLECPRDIVGDVDLLDQFKVGVCNVPAPTIDIRGLPIVGAEKSPAGPEDPDDLAVESVDAGVEAGGFNVDHDVDRRIRERKIHRVALLKTESVDSMGIRAESGGILGQVDTEVGLRSEMTHDKRRAAAASTADLEGIAPGPDRLTRDPFVELKGIAVSGVGSLQRERSTAIEFCVPEIHEDDVGGGTESTEAVVESAAHAAFPALGKALPELEEIGCHSALVCESMEVDATTCAEIVSITGGPEMGRLVRWR